jgi:TolB-like protein/tetratricopeptide (TPR) repeat protein
MAPEQALGERQVDQRADQYALAVTCYEMLTGVPPFTGPTPAAMIAQRFSQEHPPTVSRERPEVPRHMDAVLQQALALKPEDRFGSLKDFHRALTTGPSADPTISIPRGSPSPRLTDWRVAAAVALAGVLSVALVAALGLGGEDKVGTEARRIAAEGTATTGAVIAVMEFEAPGDGGYIGAAFADEVARRLSQVNSIRVLSPAATRPYGAGADRLQRLARDLRATNVLEGAVRPTGDRVAMDLRLLAVPSGRALWSFSEEHSASDLAALGGQLAREVVTVVRAPIGASEVGRVERLATASPGAYSSFLRASALDDGDRAQNEVGMDLLREAIGQDSTFALAWATLAQRFMFHAIFVSMSYRDSGLAAADRALELNPELDEAHFVTGNLLGLSGRPTTARYSFLKAIELNPSHPGAMANLSDAEATTGRFDESLYWGLRVLALYPNSPPLYHHVTVALIHLADDSAAVRWLEAGLRRWPRFSRLHGSFAFLELKQGRDSAALARLRSQASTWPKDPEVAVNLAQTAWLVGAPDGDSLVLAQYLAAPDARPYGMVPYTFRTLVAATHLRQGDDRRGRALADTAYRAATKEFEKGGEDPNPAAEAAAILALLGKRQESLDWLERAHQTGYRDYRWLPRDPFLKALSGEPRYAKLLAQMESEVATMRRRAAAANDSLFGARTT